MRFDHLPGLTTAELTVARDSLTERLTWARQTLTSGMVARDYAPERAELAAIACELGRRSVRVCAECDGRVDVTEPGQGGCTCDPADWYDDVRGVQGHPPIVERLDR